MSGWGECACKIRSAYNVTVFRHKHTKRKTSVETRVGGEHIMHYSRPIAQYASTGTECRSALRIWLRRFCLLSGVCFVVLAYADNIHVTWLYPCASRRTYVVGQTDTHNIRDLPQSQLNIHWTDAFSVWWPKNVSVVTRCPLDNSKPLKNVHYEWKCNKEASIQQITKIRDDGMPQCNRNPSLYGVIIVAFHHSLHGYFLASTLLAFPSQHI